MAELSYLSVDEVAVILHTTRNYVYQLVYQRKLPRYKPFNGRLLFDPAEIDQFIKKSRSATKEELNNQDTTGMNKKP